MDIRKTVIMMCAATCIGTTTLFAQTERELPAPGKEHFKAMPLSPEKRAKRIVNQNGFAAQPYTKTVRQTV